MRLGVITYDTPHLKTEQVALRLAARAMPFDLLAIPFTPRKARSPAFQHRPEMADAPHPREVARRLGRSFRRFAASELPTDYDLFLIAGAGILPGEIVSRVRTLNGHPGLIPAVRGLDAFKWSIHDGMELGVTLHYVDAEVDRGTPLARWRTPVFADDTIERLARRHYELEIDIMVEFERYLLRPMAPDPAIAERPSRMRMPADTEQEMLARFPAFRAKFAEAKEESA
jgi:phosphoribosylglycinamide formyltransferase-1